jgi:hypothetical protein
MKKKAVEAEAIQLQAQVVRILPLPLASVASEQPMTVIGRLLRAWPTGGLK